MCLNKSLIEYFIIQSSVYKSFPGFLESIQKMNNKLCQPTSVMAGFPAGFFSATG